MKNIFKSSISLMSFAVATPVFAGGYILSMDSNDTQMEQEWLNTEVFVFEVNQDGIIMPDNMEVIVTSTANNTMVFENGAIPNTRVRTRANSSLATSYQNKKEQENAALRKRIATINDIAQ
jgi:hypothetical protein